jgi:hypothetical protein
MQPGQYVGDFCSLETKLRSTKRYDKKINVAACGEWCAFVEHGASNGMIVFAVVKST